MRNMLAVLFAVVIVSGGPSASAGTIFKCKDPEGRMLYQETPCAQEVESVSSWASKSAPESGAVGESPSGTLVIGQSRGGHYFVDGAVNDHYLNFIIDTGATVVSLPQRVANEAGLKCRGKAVSHTANGNTTVCTATIRELKFGSFTVRNVEAVFSPGLDQPLLGMNVLKQFRVEQDSGELRLSRRY